MNFYNPYYYSMPVEKVSIFSRLNFNNILNGASKTLNVVNQTIPLVKQMSPLMKNMKTMFNLMNEFKRIDEPEAITNIVKSTKDGPTFFV